MLRIDKFDPLTQLDLNLLATDHTVPRFSIEEVRFDVPISMRRILFFKRGVIVMKYLLTMALFLIASPVFAMDVAGVWATEDGGAHVEITDCGDGTPCGTLVWMKEQTPEGLKDAENPDENLRDRPLEGIQLLWGFEPKGDKWKSGKIYDAGSGKTYKSKLELKDDGTLKVKGCFGPICQGQTWTAMENGAS